ncbi:MAG: histidine kinase [Pseudonocardiales bacterium]|nr:histidine kinase [Pseudonocardiales bacterium]
MTYGAAHGGRVDSSTRTRDRAGAHEWLHRMRLERQLHDGASLRISALTLRLGLLRRHSTDEAFQHDVTEVQDELHVVLDELREVAAKIYPPLLDQAGLGSALRELADQTGLPVTVRAGEERFGTAAEGAAYFALADALAATGASVPVAVVVGKEDRQLVISLTGVPTCHAELMAGRAEAVGGSVHVTAVTPATTVTGDAPVAEGQPDGGTITVRIPCE